MGIRENNLERIRELYKTYHLDDPNSIKIERRAGSLEGFYEREFRQELEIAEKKKHEEHVLIERKIDPDFIEELEELEEYDEEDDFLDIKIMEIIEEKIVNILHYVNIAYFTKKDLRKFLTHDMSRFLENQNMKDSLREKIEDVINHFIEHEFTEWKAKTILRKNELLLTLLNIIMHDLNEAFEQHKLRRMKKLTFQQFENFTRYLLDVIDSKYIIPFKEEKKLNQEEYGYLRNKIRTYITKKYRDLFEKSKDSEE